MEEERAMEQDPRFGDMLFNCTGIDTMDSEFWMTYGEGGGLDFPEFFGKAPCRRLGISSFLSSVSALISLTGQKYAGIRVRLIRPLTLPTY